MKVYASTLMSLIALSAIGCTASTRPQPPKHFDGKTLFRAVYFRSGPATQLFSDLAPSHVAEKKPRQAIEDRLLSRIDQSDPTFFKRLENQLYSRNHVQIVNALDEGWSKLTQVIADELKVQAKAGGSCATRCIRDACGKCSITNGAKWDEVDQVCSCGGNLACQDCVVNDYSDCWDAVCNIARGLFDLVADLTGLGGFGDKFGRVARFLWP